MRQSSQLEFQRHDEVAGSVYLGEMVWPLGLTRCMKSV